MRFHLFGRTPWWFTRTRRPRSVTFAEKCYSDWCDRAWSVKVSVITVIPWSDLFMSFHPPSRLSTKLPQAMRRQGSEQLQPHRHYQEPLKPPPDTAQPVRRLKPFRCRRPAVAAERQRILAGKKNATNDERNYELRISSNVRLKSGVPYGTSLAQKLSRVITHPSGSRILGSLDLDN